MVLMTELVEFLTHEAENEKQHEKINLHYSGTDFVHGIGPTNKLQKRSYVDGGQQSRGSRF